MVSVGEEKGVRVYHDRQLAGKTDRRGRVALTRLRPFEKNVIAFEPTDASLSATFNRTEMTVVPGFRTGHAAVFEVRGKESFLAHVVDAAGTPLPRGALLTEVDGDRAYPVGTDGRIYLDRLEGTLRLRHVANGETCQATISRPARVEAGPIHHIGEIVCLKTVQEARK